jgi:8-amino-7-oxononanoate synthase
MKQQLPKNLHRRLKNRMEQKALRKISLPKGLVDFASNDYLGLSKNTELQQAINEKLKGALGNLNGASGSRLLTGNSSLAEDLESYLADFHDTDAALLFNSGYDANVGLIGSLAGKHDLYLYDELIHASMHDGMKMSQAAKQAFPHNDIKFLESFHHEGSGDVFVLTESVFSMDGDEAPVEQLAALCKTKGWFLIVDEAHSIGVIGIKGEGLAQSKACHKDIFARVITFGKAPGVHGAAVLGSMDLKHYLINFARSLIYSTALSPHSIAAIYCSYIIFADMNKERNKLQALIKEFNQFASIKFNKQYIPANACIQSIIIIGNEKTKEVAHYLQHAGLDIRAILSPTVPRNSERIRICLHAYNTEEELTLLKTKLLDAQNIFSF